MTPKVVSNMQELITDEGDGDPSVIDGFEELSEENKDKVRKAIEQGHVDDEDWKGVCFISVYSLSDTLTKSRTWR